VSNERGAGTGSGQDRAQTEKLIMSRAFVKEDDSGGADVLPDRPISPHPNFVTPEGLAAIEQKLTELGERHAAALKAEDRAAQGATARDLRYWSARRASAQVVKAPDAPSEAAFGTTVTIERDDGRTQTWRIVGEDEADPARGTLSYVSPVARALIGKRVGDVVRAGNSDAEIVAIT
jgi:transcription elongation GreA/GreB family factor